MLGKTSLARRVEIDRQYLSFADVGVVPDMKAFVEYCSLSLNRLGEYKPATEQLADRADLGCPIWPH